MTFQDQRIEHRQRQAGDFDFSGLSCAFSCARGHGHAAKNECERSGSQAAAGERRLKMTGGAFLNIE